MFVAKPGGATCQAAQDRAPFLRLFCRREGSIVAVCGKVIHKAGREIWLPARLEKSLFAIQILIVSKRFYGFARRAAGAWILPLGVRRKRPFSPDGGTRMRYVV